MANRRDDYMNKRSWLIDTAETPADKKRLKADLKKLDAKFNPNRVASTSKTKSKDTGMQATKKQVEKVRAIAKLVAPFAPVKKTKMTQKKTPMKPGTNPKPKAPVKKKVQVMPDKISPSKMTPAQKARYLKNPERYDG